jgi:hypothetical protein
VSSPGGDEVGRVSVRVLPDTSDFARKLREDLQKIRDQKIDVKPDFDEEELRRQVKEVRDATVHVDVKADVDNLRDDIERATAGARAHAVKVPVEAEMDRDKLRSAIEDATKDSVDPKQMLQGLIAADAEIRRIVSDPVTVQMDIDRARLQRQIAQVTKDLQDLSISGGDGPEVRLRLEKAQRQLAGFLLQLEALDNRVETITLQVKLDKAKATAELQALRVLAEAETFDLNLRLSPDADARVGKQVRDVLGGLTRDPVLFKLDTDESEVRRKIAKVTEDLKRLSLDGARIEFRANAKPALDGIARVRAEIERLSAMKATPEVTTKLGKAQSELAGYLRQLDSLQARDWEAVVQTKIAGGGVELARLKAELESIDKKRFEAFVKVKTDTAQGAAELALFRARQEANRIHLKVDVDKNSFAGFTLPDLSGSLGKALTGFDGLAGGLQGAFSGVFSSVAGGFDELTGKTGALKNGLGEAAQMALQLAGAVIQVSAVGAGLALAGAAITAAWGAIATTIAVLPAAVALIGVPLGLMLLDMKGLGKAFKSLTPAFQEFRSQATAAFAAGLAPAAETFATQVLPKIKDGVFSVATLLGVAAQKTAEWLASNQGIALLNTMLDNVNRSLTAMGPGLASIGQAFLIMAGQSGAFDVLTGAVNAFGAAFKASVLDLVSNGQLTAAFAGLKVTMEQLATAFVGLVHNGILVFANAAPGLNAALASLSTFFGRFNWSALGTAVGGVFQGLADGLNRVPQGVINQIQVGLEGTAAAVNSPGFQQGFQEIIRLVGEFTAALPAMIGVIGRVATAFGGLVDVIRATAIGLSGSFDFLVGLFTMNGSLMAKGAADMVKGVGDAAPLMAQGIAKIGAAAEGKILDVNGQLVTSGVGMGTSLGTGIETGLAPVPGRAAAALAPMVPAVQAELDKLDSRSIAPSLHNADLAIEQGVKNWEATAKAGAAGVPPAVGAELGKVPPAADTALAPLQQLEALKGMKDQFTLAAADSMHAMSVGVQSGMAEVQQQFTAGMDTVSSGTNTSFGLISDGFTVGMAGLASTVTAGMPAIQAAFNFENVGLQVGQAFLGMVGTFTLGMASLAGAVTAGMPAIQAAFNFTNIGLGVGQAFLGLVGTVTLGMQSIAATVTANMALVNAAFNFTNIGLTVGQAFLGLVGSVTLGMQSIVVAVQTGMTQVLAAFNFTNVGLGVGLAFQGLVGTVTLGMASLAATVAAGMPAIAAAFNLQALALTVGLTFQGLVGTFTLGMASIAVAVTSGMAQASAAMSAGMAGMAAAASAGMAGVTAAVQAGMAQAVSAVVAAGAQIGAAAQASMAGFGNSIRAGMAAAGAAVAAGTAQMIAQFTQLAQQIVVTATTSMAAFGNAVRAGMALATSAVAAGVAAMVGALRAGAGQFNAVGVQMMNGLRAGILSQAGSIAAAAAQVVRGAVAAARAAAAVKSPSRIFMEIGSFMGEGMAIGMEGSAPRVAQAAKEMTTAALNSADKITSAFSGDQWASDFSAKVEQSFGDLDPTMSNRDVVGAIKRQSGDLDSSAQLTTMIAILGAMLTELRGGGGNAAAGAQGSRRTAELGAF